MNDHDEIVQLGVRLESLERDVQELTRVSRDQTAALNRYKGMAGGLMLAGSLFAAAIAMFFNYIRTKV